MAILGIGIDLVSLPRFRSLLARRAPDRLALRILSPSEHTLWTSRASWSADRELHFLATR
jgi:phosphopantetheinyl transferase (holo-ACP synthase)